MAEQEHNRGKERTQYLEDVLSKLRLDEPSGLLTRVSLRGRSVQNVRKRLPIIDSLSQQGWDPETVLNAKKGDTLHNVTGETFAVTRRVGDTVFIVNDMGHEGQISCSPKELKAKKYEYQTSDPRKIQVFDMAYNDDSVDTVEFIDGLVSSIPTQCLDVFQEIQIQKEAQTGGGKTRVEASLFSNSSVIVIYVDPDIYNLEESKKTLFHEIGHAVVRYLRGSTNPGERWKKAMADDATPISEYASKTKYPNKGDNGEIEDSAESFMIYVSADGASDSNTSRLREMASNRFRILDEVFQVLAQRQVESIITTLRRQIFGGTSIFDKAN